MTSTWEGIVRGNWLELAVAGEHTADVHYGIEALPEPRDRPWGTKVSFETEIGR